MAARSANCGCKACRCARTRGGLPCAATATFISSGRWTAIRRCRNAPISPDPRRSTTLKRRGAPHGITRFVIVQPSFYGFDNSATLDALDELGGNGRGVAVIDPGQHAGRRAGRHAPPRRSRSAHQPLQPAGGRPPHGGQLRRNRGGGEANELARPGDRAAAGAVEERAACCSNSPVPVVIDHYGVYGNARPDDKEGIRLLNLVRHPHVWIKLSAPYRLADGPMSTQSGSRMDQGTLCRRAAALRLGQRLAASAGGRPA